MGAGITGFQMKGPVLAGNRNDAAFYQKRQMEEEQRERYMN